MEAALRACELVELLGCGEVIDGVIDVDNTNYTPTSLPLRADWINTHLGTDISEADMITILTNLGFRVENGLIHVPSYRADVTMDADISEEVARIYGYNNIPSTQVTGQRPGSHRASALRQQPRKRRGGSGLSGDSHLYLYLPSGL